MSGGPSLWRAALSGSADPFAHVGRGTGRGPGWARAAGGGFEAARGVRPAIDVKASAVGLKGRSDVAVGAKVFHSKFGGGTVIAVDGNKLEIEFEHAGQKRVLDSFVEVVG